MLVRKPPLKPKPYGGRSVSLVHSQPLPLLVQSLWLRRRIPYFVWFGHRMAHQQQLKRLVHISLSVSPHTAIPHSTWHSTVASSSHLPSPWTSRSTVYPWRPQPATPLRVSSAPPPSTASCPAAVRATSFSSTYQSPAIFGSTFDHGILRPTHSPLRHRTGACPRVLGLRLCTLHRHHLCPLAGLSRWTLMRSNIWSRCLVIVTTIELLLSAQTFPHLGTHSRPLRPAGLSHFTSPQKAEDG